MLQFAFKEICNFWDMFLPISVQWPSQDIAQVFCGQIQLLVEYFWGRCVECSAEHHWQHVYCCCLIEAAVLRLCKTLYKVIAYQYGPHNKHPKTFMENSRIQWKNEVEIRLVMSTFELKQDIGYTSLPIKNWSVCISASDGMWLELVWK